MISYPHERVKEDMSYGMLINSEFKGFKFFEKIIYFYKCVQW